MDFIDALKRPYTRLREFVLFFVCSLIPIVNFFALGYLLDTARAAMKNRPQPRWTDWGELFKAGFFYFVIGLVYAIPVLILIAIGVAAGVLAGVLQGGIAVAALVALFIPLVLVVVLFSAYLSSAALMAYAESGRVGSAFDLRVVMHRAFTMIFFMGWLKSVLVGIMYSMITAPLTIGLVVIEMVTNNIGITVLRVIITTIVMFPAAISGFCLLGDAYRNTRR